ncbi:xanthine dehydrogenase family protein molybdopterin-binding subunit [Jannaschia aquimarina]|uniref:XdhA_4 protein n=1 Tax=Jannaschia aquimarina TaxID=935700 RepID=A0A0D1CI84_9RHOB|nr:xanthine dehydrogenase family protein molybdopterin-binding subunit [Jannaschia aquimarina]KIT14387.1 Xanthine dehydrogenase molybdenum-binding subunit [Jannaschia aquimarina]SNT42585.1 xanthine dehydrogenase YagR molybdenum-binding subunit [Jannaschia aquimarina]
MAETYHVVRDVNLPLIGKGVPRMESRAKVTGAARYAADEPLAGALHATLVTSAHAKGTLTAIDTRAAEAVPGMRLVLTHRNMPALGDLARYTTGGAMQSSFFPLASTEIRYAGQIVALVVADAPETAEEAAKLVRPRIDGVAATASMHVDGAAEPVPVPEDRLPPIRVGDMDAAFAGADTIVEGEWRTPIQHHNPIELWFTAAEWRDGGLTAHVPSQWVTGTRAALATAFDLPVSRVRVLSRHVGGAFGSKGAVLNHTLVACAAARMLGRPVALYVSRSQMFTVGTMRPAATQRIRVAVRDGRLTGLEHTQIGQTSRFDTFFLPGTEQTTRLYAWDAIRADEATVATDVNTPGFMRAPAEVPTLFGLESAIDEAAWAAGVNPLDLRLNSSAAGGDSVSGLPWTSHGLDECLRRGAEAFGWSDWQPETRAMRRGDWLHGYGLASAVYPTYTAPATADLRLGSDLSATLTGAAHDMGMGTYTIVRQIVAAELGVPQDGIAVDLGDSDHAPNSVAGGARQAASFGSAVLDAARRVRSRVIELALAEGRPLAGADPTEIAFADGVMTASDGRTARLSEVVGLAPFGVIEVRGTWVPAAVGMKSVMELYRSGNAGIAGMVTDAYARAAFGANFVEVAVHTRTGEIRVPRMVGAFAFGRVLNERTARSQLTGGMIWGVGSVLHEATEVDHRYARYINGDLGEYFVPVNADVPSVEAILVEEEDRHINPLGAKGVGELGITGVNAAIANAVHHATGIRRRDAPIRMEHMLGA